MTTKMSLLATFGVILICCHAWAIETDGYPPHQEEYATQVEEFLEKFREILKTGDESLGLPPMDPLQVDTFPFDMDNELIKVEGIVTDVDVRGIAGYVVNNGDFKLAGMKFTLNLTWPLIYAVTDYTINGILGDEMTIYGTGKINAAVEQFTFSADVSFTPKGLYLEVKSIDTDFELGTLMFKATGLFDDEEISSLLSAVISDIAPQMIHDYKEDIKGYLHPLITNLVNDFLSDKTIWDIIKIIGG